MNTNLIISNRY